MRKKDHSLDYERVFMDERLNKNSALHTLFTLYKGQYLNVFVSLFFFLCKHSPVWVVPIITANMINIAVHHSQHSMSDLWINFAVISIIIIQNIPSQIIHVGFISRVTRHLEAGLRSTLVRKLQHLSITKHGELRSGTLQSKVLRDVEAIENLSKQIMFAFVPALLNVAVAIGVTLTKNLTVAAFFIIVAPIGILIVYLFRSNIRNKNREFRRQIEHMSGQVAETVEMIPVTRAHGLEELEISKMDTTLKTLKGKGFKLDIAEAFFGSSAWVTFQLFQMLCLLFTSYLALQGHIQVGDIAMYQAYFATLLMSVNGIINVYPNIAKGFESVYSITELLVSPDTEEYRGTKQLSEVKGGYRFEHVHFHYKDTDKHVLHNFNLEVQPGENIAFVGESGAGKSTVLNMVIGFYHPTQGRILLDGTSLDELNMRAYRQRLAVVPQNTILFSGSIRDNITYGLDTVSDEQLQKVIEMANLHDVIAQLPEGLETKIGEHGGRLSGGQRQRIAIARAMIRDPHIIILDEATSALDNISEHQVQQAMQELIRGRTTFIVAHRLSTIRNADRIVVMKQGRIMEIGTYDELLERRSEFYQLKQMQA